MHVPVSEDAFGFLVRSTTVSVVQRTKNGTGTGTMAR